MTKKKLCCGNGIHPEGMKIVFSRYPNAIDNDRQIGWEGFPWFCDCPKGQLLRKKDEIKKLITGE